MDNANCLSTPPISNKSHKSNKSNNQQNVTVDDDASNASISAVASNTPQISSSIAPTKLRNNNKNNNDSNDCESRKPDIVMSMICALDHQQPVKKDLDKKFNAGLIISQNDEIM